MIFKSYISPHTHLLLPVSTATAVYKSALPLMSQNSLSCQICGPCYMNATFATNLGTCPHGIPWVQVVPAAASTTVEARSDQVPFLQEEVLRLKAANAMLQAAHLKAFEVREDTVDRLHVIYKKQLDEANAQIEDLKRQLVTAKVETARFRGQLGAANARIKSFLAALCERE